MAINTNLLIMAPVLQDYLVDKDNGFPLAAGIVTFYEDSQRNILKNWYYQCTNSSPYLFCAGPNPMTLSGVGTFTDAQGNDVIPFFYPYDENDQTVRQPYFIRVENANHELQFTRENFPFLPSQNQPSTAVPTLENYIINNEFWRNFGSANLTTPSNRALINITNYFYTTLAPSSHDGFSMPDMIMLKDIAGAHDTLTFQTFNTGIQILMNDITPEYYLEWNCSATVGGQTLKCIQFPLQLHIEALSQVSAVITFHAKVNSGASNYSIAVQILQFTGTAQTNSQFSIIQTFQINTSWNKYTTVPFSLPFADSLAKSTTGDDALYVQFVFPADKTFDIFFAKPQLYLSSTIPTNQWDNYDQIDSIINTPRTGDIRTSLNSFYPFGWVPLDDGTIGNTSSNALTRANIDTWPLFNLLWQNFNSSSALQALAPMYPSTYTGADSVSSVAYGATASADWIANRQISLTRNLGRMLVGNSANISNTPVTYTTNHAVSITDLNLTSTKGFWTGVPIQLFNSGGAPPTGLTGATIYYAINKSATVIRLASTPENAIAGTALTFSADGTGTQTIVLNLYVSGEFTGEVFGIINNAYPASVTAGASGLLTQPPLIQMNVFMKL